jgi:uncharacterized protein (DUF1330 family)
MNRPITVGLAMLAGAVLGAMATHGLHAQSSPPAFSVGELEVTDAAGYAPIAEVMAAANKKSGAKIVVRAGRVEVVEGAVPQRVVISQWRSMDDAKRFYSSAVIRKAIEDRKKFTKARLYIVEGLPN